MSTPAAPAQPRRPTARGLVKRLLRQSEQELAFWNPAVTPIGARLVLDAVADLIARSESGIEYQPDPELGGNLASWVAIHMRASGAEGEIEQHLERLKRAYLIDMIDGAVRLPIVTPSVDAGGAQRVRDPSYKAATAVDRVAEIMEHHRQQGTVPPAKFGRSAARLPDAEKARFAGLYRDARARFLRDMPGASSQSTLPLPPGMINGGLRLGVAEREEGAAGNSDIPARNTRGNMDDIPGRDNSAGPAGEYPGGIANSVAELRSSRATTAAALELNSLSNIPSNSAAAAVARAGAPAAGNSPGNSGEREYSISDILRAAPDTEFGAEAGALAQALCSGLQLPSHQERIAPGAIQLCLQQGFTVDAINVAIQQTTQQDVEKRAAGTKPITAVKYLLTKLWDAPRGHRAAPGRQETRADAAADPILQAVPAWIAAPRLVQVDIKGILLAMQASPPRPYVLKTYRQNSPEAWRLVAAERPELLDLVESQAQPKRAAAG